MKQVKSPRRGHAVGDVAVVYSRHYQINLAGLEKLHPFDIHKYKKIYLKLIRQGYVTPEDVFVPRPVTEDQIRLVHTRKFMDSLDDPAAVARYLEAPQVKMAPSKVVDAGILHAFRYCSGGTVLAGELALKHGVGINISGGYHHAKPDTGEGFNIYADMAIAIRHLQRTGRARRAMIVDLDVHQGNGSAVIFAGQDDVFTFSMHEGGIYPIPKATSDLDVELDAGAGDAQYMRLLCDHLPRILDDFRPEVVFFQAGCDVLAGDPLAHLRMTPAGLLKRDLYVIDQCRRREIPVAMTLGGGYSPGAWRAQYASIAEIMEIHGRRD